MCLFALERETEDPLWHVNESVKKRVKYLWRGLCLSRLFWKPTRLASAGFISLSFARNALLCLGFNKENQYRTVAFTGSLFFTEHHGNEEVKILSVRHIVHYNTSRFQLPSHLFSERAGATEATQRQRTELWSNKFMDSREHKQHGGRKHAT